MTRDAEDMFWEVLDKGLVANLENYDTLIDEHSKEGDMQRALQLWDGMQQKGLCPNTFT
jgi:leucine-rich PPR motif-containing protein